MSALLKSAVGVTLLAQWGRYVIQFAGIVILSRLLSASAFGVYAIVSVVALSAQLVGDLGISLSAARERHLSQAQQTKLFYITSSIGLLCCIVVLVAAPIISQFFGLDQLLESLQIAAISFLLNGVSVQFRTSLMRADRFGTLGSSDLIGAAAGLLAGVLFAICGRGALALALQLTFGTLTALVLLVLRSGWIPTRRWIHAPVRHIIKFGGATVAVQIVNLVTSNLDNILLGKFVGASSLGFYSRAYQLAGLPAQQVAAPLTRIALRRLSGRNAEEVQLLLVATNRKLSAVLLVGLSFLGGCSASVVSLLLGPGWSESINLLGVLSVAFGFQVLGYSLYWGLLALGRSSLLLRAELPGRVVLGVAIVVGVLSGGVIGAAAGVLVGQVALFLITAIVVGRARVLPVQVLVRDGAAIFVPLLVAGLVAYGVGKVAGAELIPIALLAVQALAWTLVATVCSLLTNVGRSFLQDVVVRGRRAIGHV